MPYHKSGVFSIASSPKYDCHTMSVYCSLGNNIKNVGNHSEQGNKNAYTLL